jgi:hypothetical protein
VLLEAISIFGEIILFRGVFSRCGGRMGWRISYEITLAGGAANQVLATAGTAGALSPDVLEFYASRKGVIVVDCHQSVRAARIASEVNRRCVVIPAPSARRRSTAMAERSRS